MFLVQKEGSLLNVTVAAVPIPSTVEKTRVERPMLHSKDPPFIASPLLLFMSSVNGCDNGVAVPGCIWAGMQQLQRNRPVECCGQGLCNGAEW